MPQSRFNFKIETTTNAGLKKKKKLFDLKLSFMKNGFEKKSFDLNLNDSVASKRILFKIYGKSKIYYEEEEEESCISSTI